MPIFMYFCENGHRWENLRSRSDAEAETCPACGRAGTKVPATGVRAIFKGSGWTPKHYTDRKENQ